MIPKFRVWDLIDNRMRYDIGVIEFNGINKNVSALSFDFALDDTGYGEVDNSHSEYYDANCFELMQSTGLKDKNGTEIYEGDIVKYNREISWSVEKFPYVVKNGMEGFVLEYGFIQHSLFKNIDYVSVIGNIYENTELLEDK